ncbi:MAG: thiamine pyrophosphate-dependent enzyme, partial [Clostridiales bacterium]|nr:thiamine pyrophosphate-dependent enzyme [Clostridiales bacterium]
LGGMGYGFPAAIGAQLGAPRRTVICISGDGGMQMNLQELATAVVLELPVIICVFNNSSLGMVRQWQTLFYDRRYASTCTRRRKSCSGDCRGPGAHCPPYTPDFVKLAQSYGAAGVRVEREAEIGPALRRAAAHRTGPTLIEFILDAEELVLPMVQGGQPLTRMILGEAKEEM